MAIDKIIRSAYQSPENQEVDKIIALQDQIGIEQTLRVQISNYPSPKSILERIKAELPRAHSKLQNKGISFQDIFEKAEKTKAND